jgi:hypothetical protein
LPNSSAWRAAGETHADAIRFVTTHPTTPVRFVQMREVAAEIADKERRHLPLVPDLKFPREPAAPDNND